MNPRPLKLPKMLVVPLIIWRSSRNCMRPVFDWPPLAARVLHPEERAVLDGMGSDDAVRGFFTHWARKEAVLKALGTGFYTESRSFAVPLGSVTIPAPASDGLPGPPAQVHVSSIELDPDYFAAVATKEALS